MIKILMYSIKQNRLSLLTSYKIMPLNTIEMGLSLQHMNFGSTFNLKKRFMKYSNIQGQAQMLLSPQSGGDPVSL